MASSRWCLRFLFEGREIFEGIFNRRWHGLSNEDLAKLLNLFDSMNLIELGTRVPIDPFGTFAENDYISLTRAGGRIWELVCGIKWSEYCDYGSDESIDGSPSFFWVRSISKTKVIKVTEAIANTLELGSVIRAEPPVQCNDWEWAPWKHFRRGWEGRIYFNSDCDEAFDSKVANVVESLRSGWRVCP